MAMMRLGCAPCSAIHVMNPARGEWHVGRNGSPSRRAARDSRYWYPARVRKSVMRWAVVKAIVPLAEVSNYQSQLKSVTGGQGSFAMELSHFDPVPSNVQQQIVAQYKPKQEED